MSKSRRLVPLLVLAVVAVMPTAGMAQTTTQNIGGWAPSAMPGSNVNKFGFIPAPRTPNMIWQGSLGPDPLWPSGFTLISIDAIEAPCGNSVCASLESWLIRMPFSVPTVSTDPFNCVFNEGPASATADPVPRQR